MILMINKRHCLMMLLTTVTSFSLCAQTNENGDAINQTKPKTNNAAHSNKVVSIKAHSTKTIDTSLNTQSEQVSKESPSVITDIKSPQVKINPNGLNDKENQTINSLLNQLHEAAETADWQTYFNLYHPKAVFIGTDASERWTMPQFKQYAQPTQGWRYDLQSRQLIKVDNTVVFDEQLFSPAYGVSRGTGTMIQTAEGWKVLQYHLSFPIPNSKAKRITTLIKQ